MAYARKIVLHCPTGYELGLDALVEEFIRDGVAFVGVVGRDCSKVEDIIDEIVVSDGSQGRRLLTSCHPGESIEEVVAFARSLSLDLEGADVQIVEL